jgi:hypothetical protein
MAVLAPMPSASDWRCDRCKSRALGEDAKAVAQIAQQGIEECEAAHVARIFFGERDGSELAGCAPRGFRAIHARRDVRLHLTLQMKAHFVIELALHRGAPDERTHAEAQIAAHHAVSSTDPTAATSLRHESVSRSSCFRPAAVSL